MKKRFVLLLCLTLLLSLLLIACNQEPSTTGPAPQESEDASSETEGDAGQEAPKPTEKKEKLKIGVSINSLSNIHNVRMFESVEAAIKEKGHEAVMVNANGHALQQSEDIENLVQQGVDLVIIQNGDTDALKNIVKETVEAGVPCISQDSGWIPGVTTMFSTNDYKLGAEMYMTLAAEMGYEGDIIQVHNPEHFAVRMRKYTQDALLKEFTNIKSVASLASCFPGTVEKVYKDVESALQANPNVKAIWCGFDLEAIGATQAVKALGREDIMIIGCDGEEQVLEIIKEDGPIVATFITDLEGVAKNVVGVAEQIVNGEEVLQYHETPFIKVTKENVDEFIGKFE